MSVRATIVKMTLDWCDETCQSAPCTASGGYCYNTIDTCLDEANYNRSTKDYYFTFGDGPLVDLDAYRFVDKINLRLGALDPQTGLSSRDTVEISLRDCDDDSIFTDPYRLLRSGAVRNSFARLLIARNRYHKGRIVTVYRAEVVDGAVDLEAATTISRTYRIERIKLTSSGWMIEAVDLLSPLGDCKIPRETTHALASGMDESTTSVVLQTGEGASYSAGDTIRIDDEIMDVSGVTGDTLTVSRANWGTTAATHSTGTRVQQCMAESGTAVHTAWANLLTSSRGAGIASAQVDSSGAETEFDLLYDDLALTYCLSEPDGGDTIMTQFNQGLNCMTHANESIGKIVALLSRPVRPGDTVDSLTDEAHLIGDRVTPTPQESRRYTRVIVYYGVRDWSKALTSQDRDEPNFRVAEAYIKADEEAAIRHGESKTLRIFAWMIPATATVFAQAIASRVLNRYTRSPIRTQVTVLDSDLDSSERGAVVYITTPEICDADGASVKTQYTVLSRSEAQDGTGWVTIAAETTRWDNLFGMWAPDDVDEVLSEANSTMEGATVISLGAYEPDKWYLSTSYYGSIEISTDDARSGSESLKMIDPAGNQEVKLQTDPAALRGKSAKFTIYVKGTSSLSVRARIQGTDVTADEQTQTVDATGWTRFEVTGAVGASATSLQIKVRTNGAGTIYIDDASLQVKGEGTRYTDEQKAAWGRWTDGDGLLSDGTEGSRWV